GLEDALRTVTDIASERGPEVGRAPTDIRGSVGARGETPERGGRADESRGEQPGFDFEARPGTRPEEGNPNLPAGEPGNRPRPPERLPQPGGPVPGGGGAPEIVRGNGRGSPVKPERLSDADLANEILADLQREDTGGRIATAPVEAETT